MSRAYRIVEGLFGRWCILHPTDDLLAWSGSRWVLTGIPPGVPLGEVQVCNFPTEAEAAEYANSRFAATEPHRMKIPVRLLRVLNPDEQKYFAGLMVDAEQEQTPEEFAATVKAWLALFKDGPRTKLTLTVSGATDADLAAIRARLTPEEDAHLELRRT